MTLLEELEASVQTAVERSGPAVVGLGRGWGVGSGVVIEPGRVLTNAHNLRHDEVTVTFADGRRETARLAGSDDDVDIAVLEVDTGSLREVSSRAGALDELRQAGDVVGLDVRLEHGDDRDPLRVGQGDVVVDQIDVLRSFVTVLADASVKQRFGELGQEIPPPDQQTPAALGAFQKAETEKWWPIVKAADIKAE